MGIFSALAGRLIHIQVVERPGQTTAGRGPAPRTEIMPATRGMIVDRREEPIAKSIPVVTVIVDRKILMDANVVSFGLAYEQANLAEDWPELDAKARRHRIRLIRSELLARETEETLVRRHLAYTVGHLARPLGMKREDLLHKIESTRANWFPIARDVPDDIAERLRETVETQWIQGIEFEKSLKRWYTEAELASHIVGFTGEIEVPDEHGLKHAKVVGRYGVEATMEEFLAGRDGWRQHRRDARGLVLPGEPGSLFPPRAGLNVQLTLDMGLQTIVEEELDAGLQEFVAPRGTVILMDPANGEILALASRPNFNKNTRENILDNGLNFATQAVYEPGSTFKIVAAAAAINEGLANPMTSIFCHNGYLREGAFEIRDPYPYGYLTLEGVMAKSSNIGTYKLARQLGAKRFYDYVDRFGFGQATGIHLSLESPGRVRNSGNPTDFSRSSYGYALNVTPLQMTAAYGAIANDGKIFRPKLIKALVANDGTIVDDFPPELVSQPVQPDTARRLLKSLEKVVETGGTATRAAVPGFRVAGKTGTARRIHPRGGYYKDRHTVSFVGMMPAQAPAFVCIVVIDDPRIEGMNRYGGTIAAPIFSRIASRAASRMNLQPTEPLPAPLANSSR